MHASGRLDVYIEPELMESVAKFLLHLPGVRIFAPSARQSLDKDHCELLKVNWSAELADCGSTAGGNCALDEKFMKWVNVNKLFEEKKTGA